MCGRDSYGEEYDPCKQVMLGTRGSFPGGKAAGS